MLRLCIHNVHDGCSDRYSKFLFRRFQEINEHGKPLPQTQKCPCQHANTHKKISRIYLPFVGKQPSRREFFTIITKL